MTIITSLVTTVKRERLHHSHYYSFFFGYKYHFERNATTVYFPPKRKPFKKDGCGDCSNLRKISKATISEKHTVRLTMSLIETPAH